jgi:hypothetical protein
MNLQHALGLTRPLSEADRRDLDRVMHGQMSAYETRQFVSRMNRQNRQRATASATPAALTVGARLENEKRAAIQQQATQHETWRATVDAARRQVLEDAIRGDAWALNHLRTAAQWFPDSTANQRRDHRRPPSSDAEIIAGAKALLPVYAKTPAAPASRTLPAPAAPPSRPTLASQIYGVPRPGEMSANDYLRGGR